MLAKGANVGQTCNYGATSLVVSRSNGHHEVVKLLLASESKVDETKGEAEEEEKEDGQPKRKVRVCKNCGKEASKIQKCSRCRLVRYCSRDWAACGLEGAQEEVQESGRAGEGREGELSGGRRKRRRERGKKLQRL